MIHASLGKRSPVQGFIIPCSGTHRCKNSLIACLPIFYTGHLIARWEGALFFGYYIVYVLYLVLEATEHDALDDFRFAMVTFVLPLTAVTLLTLAIRSFRARRRRRTS